MPSEYDPLFARAQRGDESGDLEPVRDRFLAASKPYLRAYWTWLAWALILPAAAFLTPTALSYRGPRGVLFLWSIAILLGGAVEFVAIRKAGQTAPVSGLARWALRAQGNLSFVAVLLSGLLFWVDAAWAVPGVWLLLLGHSFYILGGISFPPFRRYGLIYQIGGFAALWPGGAPLLVLAVTLFMGNLWMAWAVWRERA
ncbi:MAG: hypothetical protein ABJC13_05750 [Acidobacteriota bacterium]